MCSFSHNLLSDTPKKRKHGVKKIKKLFPFLSNFSLNYVHSNKMTHNSAHTLSKTEGLSQLWYWVWVLPIIYSENWECTIWPHLRQNRQWPPMQMLLWQKFFGIMSKHIIYLQNWRKLMRFCTICKKLLRFFGCFQLFLAL